jgi:hypothetical protein
MLEEQHNPVYLQNQFNRVQTKLPIRRHKNPSYSPAPHSCAMDNPVYLLNQFNRVQTK